MSDHKPTAYAYGRYSTPHQTADGKQKRGLGGDVYGLKNQEFRCRKWYEFELQIDGVAWGGFHADEAESGGTPFFERKTGRKLCDLMLPGDHIIMLNHGRGFRDLVDADVTVKHWNAREITLHLTDMRVDTKTAMGKMLFRSAVNFNQFERETLSERTCDGLATKKRECEAAGKPFLIGKAPLGKRWTGRRGDKQLVPYAEELALMQAVVALHDDKGFSFQRIWLNFIDKKVHSTRKAGKPWSLSSIKRLYDAGKTAS